MSRRVFVAISMCVAAVYADANELAYLQSLRDTSYFPIESEQLGRTFHIYVTTPDAYDDEREYPTVYLLDGGALHPMLVAYQRYLQFGEEVPPAILVAVSYGGSDFASGNFRSTDYTAPSDERDYWGGAEKFQVFLETAVIPLVESRFRSDPKRRVLFGQSLGGQFVLYSAQTKPSLFWGRIASNPALHRNLGFFLAQRPPPGNGDSGSRLFVASATGDDPRFRGPALEWIRHWSATEDKPWTLHTQDLEGHSHMSAPPASYRDGMRWLFAPDAKLTGIAPSRS